MGGPFWVKKDAAAWSIPKGEYLEGEPPLDAALREFAEEIGTLAPDVDYQLLGEFKQSSGKIISAFIAEVDLDLQFVASNTFDVEWPPRSGRIQSFPEIDDAQWFSLDDARIKLVKGQLPMISALEATLSDD